MFISSFPKQRTQNLLNFSDGIFSPFSRLYILESSTTKKRVSNAAIVPKTTPATAPAATPTIVKAQNGTSAVPTQPTPELPQSASVSAPVRKNLADEKAANTENQKPEPSEAVTRPITQNPLTAIMNDKSMVLTRQYRQRVRIKYSGERSTRVNTLNERNTTKENIPKAVKANTMKNVKPNLDDGIDGKLSENVLNEKNEANSSAGQSASVRASAAAAQKVKKRARKIATSASVKMQRTYKIDGKSGDKLFPCSYCGRKYRWKSTLRRHENDECGNKEPSHQCPYCPYKAKQRGNLGVHVRKHHSDKPKLESSRKRKTI